MLLALLLALAMAAAAQGDGDTDDASTTSVVPRLTEAAKASTAPARVDKGLGRCPFCPANRTRAAVAAAAKSVVVVRVTKSARSEADEAGDGGLSRDYTGLEQLEGACSVAKLVQEVSRPDVEGRCEAGDRLRKGRVYRLSGQCEGRTFFADPCGLRERLSREEAALLGGSGPSTAPTEHREQLLRKRLAAAERQRDEARAETTKLKKQGDKAAKRTAQGARHVGEATEAARRAATLVHSALAAARRERRKAREVLDALPPSAAPSLREGLARLVSLADKAAHRDAQAQEAARGLAPLLHKAAAKLRPQ